MPQLDQFALTLAGGPYPLSTISTATKQPVSSVPRLQANIIRDSSSNWRAQPAEPICRKSRRHNNGILVFPRFDCDWKVTDITGTCAIIVAMMATFRPGELPPISKGHFFPETSVATYPEILGAALKVRDRCIEDRALSQDDFITTRPGWITTGLAISDV